MNGRPIKLLLDEHIWEGLLVRLWYEVGREHAGIQLPPTELLKQAERLLVALSADDLKNTVRWLQEFKVD